jgi:hypothetical protein
MAERRGSGEKGESGEEAKRAAGVHASRLRKRGRCRVNLR